MLKGEVTLRDEGASNFFTKNRSLFFTKGRSLLFIKDRSLS